MNTDLFTLVATLASVVAGFFGALTGLGGGVIIVPFFHLVLGVDIHYVIGASLVAVIASSSAASATYLREAVVNLRIATLLGVATVVGALIGAKMALITPTATISLIFGLTLFVIALLSMMKTTDVDKRCKKADSLASRLRLDSVYLHEGKLLPYHVKGVIPGQAIMLVAGFFSGLLGIGSGALKVLALDKAMRLPFRVSTATSNLMIGVTAAASAGLYLHQGYIHPTVAFPVLVGGLLGAVVGARCSVHIHTKKLRLIFLSFLFLIAVQMVWHGLS